MRNVAIFLFCLLSLSPLWAAETLVKIPFKQDPPIIVDGNLEDWNDVPARIKLNGREHSLKFGKQAVAVDEKDMSAELAFCWKPIGMYMAAKVKDDKLVWRGNGMEVFNGDHVELFIDMIPNEKGDGPKFGKRQFQLGIGPGDFGMNKAEIAVAHPSGVVLSQKAVCASEKTEDGWNLEAFIPWSDLDAGTLKGNEVIGFTAWLSDTDADTGSTTAPDCILTTGKPDAAFRMRSDLELAVFTDSNGKHTAAIARAKSIPIADTLSVESGKSQQLSFAITTIPGYLTPVLRLNANIKTSHVFSGYARVMQIRVNGRELDNYNLLAPENEFRTKNGEKGTIYQAGHGFLLPYTNDGKAGNDSANTLRFFANHYNMHDFALDLSGLLKPGENTIEFRNTLDPKYVKQLEAEGIRVTFEAVEKKAARKGAPTGKLPFIRLKPQIPMSGEIAEKDARFDIRQKNAAYVVASRFSTPDGKWATGSNQYFRHERTVERRAELWEITDAFTNLTQENLPLIQEHQIAADGKDIVMQLCGIEATDGRNIRRSLGNYSVFVGSKSGGGVGLYAVNPEFQIHFGAFIPAPRTVVMCDDQTVIPPGKTAVRKIVLVVMEEGGYYDFVNVTRRHIGANTTMNGPCGSWAAYKWMEAYYERLNIYNINHLDLDLPVIGRAFLNSPQIPFVKSMIGKIRKVRPGIKILRYYHSQIEADETAPWTEGQVLLKNGQGARYGNSRIFLNLEGTAYSQMMEQVIDDLLENWDIDGVYWDEFNACGVDFHYGEPWDECSGDINPVTHRIAKLKSSVFLLNRHWKNRMADKIRAKGKIITANGGGALMGEFAGKVESTFTETQFASNNARVHFSTPISHANSEHMDRSKFSPYYEKFLSALDWGCLFAYSFLSQPHTGAVYHTFSDYIYPSTPLEIHEGYVIAKERIATNRSGMFGWEDASGHEIHVYDYTGREISNHNLKTTTIDGKTWSEIRLPQDWSAIIIRK